MSYVLLQFAGSSDPSTQSLSRSHTHTRGMQRFVMAHWNWLGAHVTSAAEETRDRNSVTHTDELRLVTAFTRPAVFGPLSHSSHINMVSLAALAAEDAKM